MRRQDKPEKIKKLDPKKTVGRKKTEKTNDNSNSRQDIVAIHHCNNEFCHSDFYLPREVQESNQECPSCGNENTYFSHTGRTPPQQQFAKNFETPIAKREIMVKLICCVCNYHIEVDCDQVHLRQSCPGCKGQNDTFRFE